MSSITYEQPLNERIRTFLRIEYLFDLAEHHIEQEDMWDCRQAITALLDINDILTRSDIKSELVKELERHAGTLSTLKKNPGVDGERLAQIMEDLSHFLTSLREPTCQPGQTLRQDELISFIRQRASIQGGACNFDLPGYHHWLHQPWVTRRNQLHIWQADLLVIKKSLKLALLMLRNSSNPTTEIAEEGFFQRPMEAGLGCQLIRVKLPEDSPYYPEISGGKHRFSIRFLEQPDTGKRPVQTGNTVEFQLHCCVL